MPNVWRTIDELVTESKSLQPETSKAFCARREKSIDVSLVSVSYVWFASYKNLESQVNMHIAYIVFLTVNLPHSHFPQPGLALVTH